LNSALPARQQISELALAGNHNRHPGKPRSRNQRKVRVKVKGVGNLNVLIPQMTRQAKSRLD
jgi:hypothetical protein